jgi:growth factor-regulated tyrosine kinase substrate
MTFFKSNFSKVLEKCTSNLLLEPDWDGMLQLCDFIRGNDIKTRDAIGAIKKTLEIANPHQQYFGYCVLDTVVKNCGSPVHQEVIKRAFLEQLKERLQGRVLPLLVH